MSTVVAVQHPKEQENADHRQGVKKRKYAYEERKMNVLVNS